MSKKNLAGTVIEGGRVSSSKKERRTSHSLERNAVHEFCHRVILDPDYAEGGVIKLKNPVWKDFADKLGPMNRWLGKQVGRPWDDVFSEIIKKFDSRTTAGRHIVYGHLLPSVQTNLDVRYPEDDPTVSHYQNSYYVDNDKILRKKQYVISSWRSKQPKCDTSSLTTWLNGRVPGKVGNKWFWFVPVTKSKKHFGYSYKWKTEWGLYKEYWRYGGLKFLYLANVPVYGKDKNGNKIISKYEPTWCRASPSSFRQETPFSQKDISFWESFPEFYQKKVLEFSPMVKGK